MVAKPSALCVCGGSKAAAIKETATNTAASKVVAHASLSIRDRRSLPNFARAFLPLSAMPLPERAEFRAWLGFRVRRAGFRGIASTHRLPFHPDESILGQMLAVPEGHGLDWAALH